MINYGSIEVKKIPQRPKRTVGELLQTELAWAAGFFDGEGSTVFAPASKVKTHVSQLNLRAPQSGEYAYETLTRFKKAVGGLGAIYGPYDRGNRKPEYQFSVGNFESVQAIIAMLWKYLSRQKRDQAKAALQRYNAYLQSRAIAQAA